MNEHQSLQLRCWQRKKKSDTTILDLIEESDPETSTTATITEEAIAGPGR
jgi:hypothetical protein